MQQSRAGGVVLGLVCALSSCGNVNTLARRTSTAEAGAADQPEPSGGAAGEAGASGGTTSSAGESGAPPVGGDAGCEGADCCKATELFCAVCVDPGRDPQHCGACDVACDAGTQACVAGRCADCSPRLMPPLVESSFAGVGRSLAIGDFTGDGRDDRAYTDDTGLYVELGSPNGLNALPLELAGGQPAPTIADHGDYDADGKEDLLLRTGDDTMLLLWGEASGNFAETSVAAAGLVAHGDFDDDGRLDLAVYRDPGVTLLWGRPGRAFEVAGSTPALQGATGMVALDVTHDGKLDLTFGADDALQAFAGDGKGGFEPKTANEIPGLRAFTLADLEGDAKPDLIMSRLATVDDESWIQGRVSVFQDYAGYLFAGSVNYLAGNGTTDVPRVADVNGDGDLDLLLCNTVNSSVDLLLGNGDGSFEQRRAFSIGARPFTLAIGDLDGDQRPDITGMSWATLTTAYHAGAGLFGQRVYPLPAWPEQIVLRDVTADGQLDAIVTNSWGNVLSVLSGTPSGELEEPESVTHDPENSVGYSSPIVVADFDGDDRPELAVIRAGVGLSVYRRTNAGQFELQNTFPWSGTVTSLSAGDLNGDGKTDLVATEGFGSSIRVRLGRGDGDFEASVGYASGAWPSDTFLEDMDHDDKLDLVVANYSDKNVAILRGDGAGSLAPMKSVAVSGQPLTLQRGDLNGDGWTDVVVGYRGSIGVLLGAAGGELTPEVVYDSVTPYDHSGNSGPTVAIVDVNGDGRLDLATTEVKTTQYGAHYVAVLQGRGDGSFLPKVSYPTGWEPGAIAAGDLDHDGKAELLVLNRFSNALNVLSNQSRCE
jgi:hypothetical protein